MFFAQPIAFYGRAFRVVSVVLLLWDHYLPTREMHVNEADAFASGRISDED
jgi:hypothetical protein